MKELSQKTSAIAFENSVSVSSILWLGGLGDWDVHDSDQLEGLEWELFSDNSHPSLQPLREAVEKAEAKDNQDVWIEVFLEFDLKGFVVSLSTPVPHDFFDCSSKHSSEKRWGWNQSWSQTTGATVYVEDLSEIPDMMSRLKEDVVKRELEKFLQAQKKDQAPEAPVPA